MEAAAAGTPTVGFDVPGVRDSVRSGVTGVVATHRGRLSARLDACADETYRERLGRDAHAWAAEHHVASCSKRFLAVAQQALDRT